jgi:hypothetical protein
LGQLFGEVEGVVAEAIDVLGQIRADYLRKGLVSWVIFRQVIVADVPEWDYFRIS